MCANNDCDNIMIIDKGLASWAPDRDPPSNQQILEYDQNTTSCKNSKKVIFWHQMENNLAFSVHC